MLSHQEEAGSGTPEGSWPQEVTHYEQDDAPQRVESRSEGCVDAMYSYIYIYCTYTDTWGQIEGVINVVYCYIFSNINHVALHYNVLIYN